MSDRVELRRATAVDASGIRRLTRQAYAGWALLIGREPKPMTADYQAALRDHRFDLLHVSGLLAGLIETVEEGDQLLIENVAVAPSFQGRGFGRILMGRAEEIAVELGHNRIRLYTNRLFAQNIQLYKRLGYIVEREEDLGIAVAVHMSKTPLAADSVDSEDGGRTVWGGAAARSLATTRVAAPTDIPRSASKSRANARVRPRLSLFG